MNENREMLRHILDVFTGADGGVAFARLQFSMIPDWIEKAQENPESNEA